MTQDSEVVIRASITLGMYERMSDCVVINASAMYTRGIHTAEYPGNIGVPPRGDEIFRKREKYFLSKN